MRGSRSIGLVGIFVFIGCVQPTEQPSAPRQLAASSTALVMPELPLDDERRVPQPGSQFAADIACANGQALVLFKDYGHTPVNYRGLRVDSFGNAIDRASFAVASGSSDISLAYAQGNYACAWRVNYVAVSFVSPADGGVSFADWRSVADNDFALAGAGEAFPFEYSSVGSAFLPSGDGKFSATVLPDAGPGNWKTWSTQQTVEYQRPAISGNNGLFAALWLRLNGTQTEVVGRRYSAVTESFIDSAEVVLADGGADTSVRPLRAELINDSTVIFSHRLSLSSPVSVAKWSTSGVQSLATYPQMLSRHPFAEVDGKIAVGRAGPAIDLFNDAGLVQTLPLGSSGSAPLLCSDGTVTWTAWDDGRDVWVRMFEDGGLSTPSLITMSPPNQFDPSIAFDGTGHVAIWSEDEGPRILLLDVNLGHDAGSTQFAPNPQIVGHARVHSGEGAVLLTWEGRPNIQTAAQPWAQLRFSDGGVSAPVELFGFNNGFVGDIAAAQRSSGVWLIGWSEGYGLGERVRAVRISANGALMDSQPLTMTATGYADELRIAPSPSGWRMVWTEGDRSGPPDSRAIVAADVSAALLATRYALTADGFNETAELLSEHDGGATVFFSRSTTGYFGPRALVSAPWPQPASSSDGGFAQIQKPQTSRLIGAQRHGERTLLILEQPDRISGLWLHGAGSVPEAEFIANGSEASAASGLGAVSVVYRRDVVLNGLAYPRVYGRRMQFAGASALGKPCARDADCASAICADFVCCDTSCGSSTNDCQACSVATGASVDGRCGPIVAGRSCRKGFGACDVDEVCDGISLSCPPDVPAARGTVCAEASGACDMDDVCDGVSTACPSLVMAAGTVCAPAASSCDVAQPCDGLSTYCPRPLKRADGEACDVGVCRAGQCEPQPSRRCGCSASDGVAILGAITAAGLRLGKRRRRFDTAR